VELGTGPALCNTEWYMFGRYHGCWSNLEQSRRGAQRARGLKGGEGERTESQGEGERDLLAE
jgi:hypothetical protein